MLYAFTGNNSIYRIVISIIYEAPLFSLIVHKKSPCLYRYTITSPLMFYMSKNPYGTLYYEVDQPKDFLVDTIHAYLATSLKERDKSKIGI